MSEGDMQPGGESFWDHLDVLRGALLRMLAVTVVCAVIAFIFKDEVFEVLLAPKERGFVTYRLLERMALAAGGMELSDFSVSMINTGLARQFMIHMQAAMCIGVLGASPYILYELFRFVSPGLYASERRCALDVVGWGYVMFIVGALVGYYLVFPLTFRFLGTYQVSDDVVNMISLDSYMGTLLMICLSMGVVFEMPVVCRLLGRLGILEADFMRRYRRHAIVLILTLAAIITPTTDIFTLMVVALPMWALYEVSIRVVSASHAKTDCEQAA